MDKVVLIFPKTGLDKYSQLPLGLLSVASTIVDDYESQNSICVGITSMTGEQKLNGFRNFKSCKKNTNVIWGGIHPTILPKQTLENKYIDFIVLGEGEVTIPQFINALTNKKEFNSIKGIGYKDRTGIHIK